MKKAVYLIICALCFANIPIANANTLQLDLSSPETTVRSFVGSLNQYNFKQAALCVEGAKPELSEAAEMFQQDLRKEHITLSISKLHSTMNETDATVTLTVTVKVGETQKASSVHESHLTLRKQAREWKILSDDSYLYSNNSDVLKFMVGILRNSETSEKIFETAKENARGNSCRSNLKQLALAMQIFVQDHKGIFAITDNTFTELLKPYIVNNSIYICPSDKTPHLQTNGDKTSYSFNANLENISSSSIKNSSQVVLFYEGKNGALNFRHNDEASVAFVDGSTKLVNRKDAGSLRWKP